MQTSSSGDQFLAQDLFASQRVPGCHQQPSQRPASAARTHCLGQHSLVIVLQPIGQAENREQPYVDLANKLLLFLCCPGHIAAVVYQYLVGFITVHCVNRELLLELFELLELIMIISGRTPRLDTLVVKALRLFVVRHLGQVAKPSMWQSTRFLYATRRTTSFPSPFVAGVMPSVL